MSLAAAAAALRGGDARQAAALFEAAAAAAARPADGEAWLGLALARRGLRDLIGAIAALDRVLSLRPGDARALILKGDCLAAAGRKRDAARHYAGAVHAAGPLERVPAALAGEVRRAGAARAALTAEFDGFLEARMAAAGFARGRSSARFGEALDLMAGRAEVQPQRPSVFYMPQLAAIPFFERAAFPWLDALEAAAPAIRAELDAILADEFAPYVEADAIRAGRDGGGLAGNAAWSAFYLWRDGAVVAANAERCPATMAALDAVPLARVAGRTPSALFSRLAPGARIPPHTGFVNTRLICHLGLIVPPGCWLRAGNHRRAWEEGRAWVFDDTIEHEAANESDATRTVLLFDVWRPELTVEERGLLAEMYAAIDAYEAGERWQA